MNLIYFFSMRPSRSNNCHLSTLWLRWIWRSVKIYVKIWEIDEHMIRKCQSESLIYLIRIINQYYCEKAEIWEPYIGVLEENVQAFKGWKVSKWAKIYYIIILLSIVSHEVTDCRLWDEGFSLHKYICQPLSALVSTHHSQAMSPSL